MISFIVIRDLINGHKINKEIIMIIYIMLNMLSL